VFDFGARRAHGLDAATSGARALYVAGVAGTSNVLAGRRHGIPVAGTMAHSFVQAHEDELTAFRAFASSYPDTVLLVDTYDTLRGVQHVIELARELGADFRVRALRLDSGDLAALAVAARRMLDGAGLHGVELFASGGLDERSVAALVESGAPIDGFGVGTRMNTSADAPHLDAVYKLVEYDGRGRLKLSIDKETLPGRKQVFRVRERGEIVRDVLGLRDEQLEGTPLLQPVMRDGRRLAPPRELDETRAHAAKQRDALPARLRALDPAGPGYPVEVSERLRAGQSRLRDGFGG
jgi:nicotinate phosphoribosyltransferase